MDIPSKGTAVWSGRGEGAVRIYHNAHGSSSEKIQVMHSEVPAELLANYFANDMDNKREMDG